MAARSAVVLVLALACPVQAAAQAWVTPDGEGSVSVLHQFVTSGVHLDRDGKPNRELGRETMHIVFLDTSLGITDRLDIGGSLVWLATKWEGHHGDRHGPLDTGEYHGTVQDGRIALRYQLGRGPIAVAPFVAFGSPLARYETRGHSAFGRKLRELQLGASVGRDLPFMPGGYASASVAYAFAQGVEDVPFDLDRINGDFEAGSAVGRRVSLRGFGAWQVMRDGLTFPLAPQLARFGPIHDRLARASYLQLGGGATFAATRRLDVVVNAFATARGKNMHALNAVVTGVTWKFGGGFRIASEAASQRASR